MGEMCRMWGFLCTWKYENNYLSMFSCNTARAISPLERKYNFLGTAGGTWQSSWVSFDSYKIPFFWIWQTCNFCCYCTRAARTVPQPSRAGSCVSRPWQRGAGGLWQHRVVWLHGGRGNTAQLSSARVAVHRDGCSWLRQAIRSGCRAWLIQ